jgi:hypothetical protein
MQGITLRLTLCIIAIMKRHTIAYSNTMGSIEDMRGIAARLIAACVAHITIDDWPMPEAVC